MSILHRNRNTPAKPDTTAPQKATVEPPTPSPPTPSPPAPSPPAPSPPAASSTRKAPFSRISAAWLGICIAAATLVVLIVFMLQNTGNVEVTFLWMQGSLPLAMALLIAAVGAAILTMTAGTARITQLRRRLRQDRSRKDH
jgi:uncharacterized integral membrane protein